MDVVSVPAERARRTAVRAPLVREALKRELPLVVVVGAYVATAHLLHATVGYPLRVGISLASWRSLTGWTAVYGVMAYLAVLGYGMIRHGRSLRDGRSYAQALGTLFRPRLLLSFAVVYVLLPPFMSAFMGFKISIPALNAFAWDVQFMEWDRILHLGRHPWSLTDLFLGSPLATAFIDQVYYTWFPFVWLTLVWQLWHGDYFSDGRSQFLLSFALCWIVLGTAAATVFSSAGPAYYGAVVGNPNPYGPLMARLEALDAVTPLTALWAQDMLWQSYVDPAAVSPVEGISAMPSMHVTMVTLMSLIAFRVNRWLGAAYTLYAVLIFLGSVHLGWHYALDGYVAVLGTLVIWALSGRLLEVWEGRRTDSVAGAS